MFRVITLNWGLDRNPSFFPLDMGKACLEMVN